VKKWFLSILTLILAIGLLAGCSSDSNPESSSNVNVSTNNTGDTVDVDEDSIRITISLNDGQEFINETQVPYEENTVLMDVLKENFYVEEKDGFITSIERVQASKEDHTEWVYYVNDEIATVGAAEYVVQPGDKIVFDLQSSKY